MKRLLLTVALSFATGALHAQPAADTILSNGKIVTVDDFFSVRQAVAISGERIMAVGDDETIVALAGPDTRIVDLQGRTVIPGLIDNHNHVIRATEYWPNEARLDGVSSRAEALARFRAKVDALPADQWLMSLGGWTENQFEGDQSGFTLEELDAIAGSRPAFIQSTYQHAFGNTALFEALGIPLVAGRTSSIGSSPIASYVERDAAGHVTGRINGEMPMFRIATTLLPEVPEQNQLEGIREAFSYLNSIGLTAVYDPAGGGIRPESYGRIRGLAADEGLTLRVFHTLARGAIPRTPEEADGLIAEIRAARPYQGDSMLDLIAMGENYYMPLRDTLAGPVSPSEADLAVGRRILEAAADGGWSVQTHIMNAATIDRFLDVVEAVNEEYPMRQLRWSITHADRIERPQIERLRRLGMNLQIRSISVLYEPQRVALFESLGEAALNIPPLRMIQSSGIPWGLGTDGTKAAQINPFVTLWWAVTGRALNGERVLGQTLSREEALIAHTRSNAYLMFQESNIGSIRPGLMADLLVLDRDYLTVPAREIKDIQPLATLVGGRIVWGSL